MGDLTDVEFAAQRAVTEWAAHVPAWVLPLVVVVIAGLVAWRRRGSHVEDPAVVTRGERSPQEG